MAKRINQLDVTKTIADDNVFAIDSDTSTGKTCKITFASIKNALSINLVAYYVIKTNFVEGRWYRVWSDGYCEQGGKIQTIAANNIQYIGFILPFIDNNVFINATPCGTDLGDNAHLGIYYNPFKGYSITKDGFYYKNDLNKGEYIMWEAKGKVDISKI